MERQRNISFTKYRRTDLFVWCVILSFFESVVFFAGSKWFSEQYYTFSLVPSITAIVSMRWGWYSVFHSCLGGFLYGLLSGGSVQQISTYLSGNAFCLLAVLILNAVGKEKVRQSAALSALFAVLTAVLMQTGRAVVSLCFGSALKAGLTFITTDSLSGVFAVVIVLIARNADGLFEDQKQYLFRINNEKEGENDE